ncbi:MAG: hypothetical protein ACLFQ5_03395 [Oceanicaulis sp.]
MPVRHAASLTVIAATLALAGCGGEEETRRAGDPAAQGAEGSAADALAALGLAEKSRASWESMTQDGDTYTFTSFTLATDEGVLSAETLILTDPRMSEQGPVFERFALSAGDLVYDEGLARFASFALSEAGPGVGQALANFMTGQGGLDDIPLERQTFSELTLDTLQIETEAGEDMGPGELVIALVEASGFDGETLERFTLTDLAYDASNADGEQVAIDIGEVAASGVNVELLQSGAEGDMGAAPLGSLTGGFDQYETVSVSGLRLVAGGLRVLMLEFGAEVEERRGGTLVSTAAMPVLTLDPNPDSANAAGFADALSRLGYEEMVFSLASEAEYDPGEDRVTSTGENYVAMEDGFLLAFQQDLSGIEAYADALADWAEGQDFETKDGEQAPTPPAEIYAPLMVHSAEIRLEDRSLIDRALTMMAEQQGTTPAQLRAQAELFVAMGAAMAGEAVPQALLTQLSGALTSFIGQGGALIVEFEPQAPVSAARLVEGGADDLDGLSVRHEPAE